MRGIALPCVEMLNHHTFQRRKIAMQLNRVSLCRQNCYIMQFLKSKLFHELLCIWDSFRENALCYIYKSYKNHLRLNCYNFETENAIDFKFLTLHTTPFLYSRIDFGVLHLLCASVAMSDTTGGSKSPYYLNIQFTSNFACT